MNFIFYCIVKFITILSSRLKIKFFSKLFNILNNEDQDYFFSYNFRKKFFKKKKLNKKRKSKNKSKISIIIQGPIIRRHNFTLNTINLYLENCSSQIILSTWENELNRDEEKKLKKLGVEVIISKIPEISGPMNLNLQIASTFQGLKLSKKLNNNFSIKTRSDCRIYLKNFELNIFNYFSFFKKTNNLTKFVSTSFTIDKRLYGISDFVMFGKTSDLINYFDNSNIIQKIKNFDDFLKSFKNKKKLFGNVDLKIYPENFLCYNFVKKNISSKIKYNSKDYYKILKKFFLILDNSSLDLFWYKYDHQYEYRDKNFGDIKGNKDAHLSFFNWLNLK